MPTFRSNYGNVSNDANAAGNPTISLTTTTNSGATLCLQATGDPSPVEAPLNCLLAVFFILRDPLVGDNMSALLLNPSGRFIYDVTDFRRPNSAARQEVDKMLASAGFPAECAPSVEFFCTYSAGMAASQRWRGATVIVEMTASDAAPERSDLEVEKLTYGEEVAGVIREEGCGICFEEFVDGAAVGRLPCSHVYHEKCLRQWLDRERACPYCRAPVRGKV